MKWPKRILVALGIIALIIGCIYGYFFYENYQIRQKLIQGRNHYQTGKFNAVLAGLQEVYKKNPHSPEGVEAAYLLAESYMALDQLAKAKEYWQKLFGSVGARQYQDRCLFSLAAIAESDDDNNMAIKYYQKVIKEYPQSALVDDALWSLAAIYRNQNQLIEARQLLNRIIEEKPDSNLISSVQNELGAINIQLLFSSVTSEDSEQYLVKGGDTLDSIARQFNTTVALLKRCNNLKSDFIKPGQRLKVVSTKFSLLVDKSRNTLILKGNEKVIKVYIVGTGVQGSTPTGDFTITNKMINPPWYKSGEGVVPFGDPENVLGTRWMGFDLAGYGIHGTWEPDSVGKQSSAGCIRLVNSDAEELFEIVAVGTVVTIVE